MPALARRGFIPCLMFAALLLVACSSEELNPAPTPSKTRPPTITKIAIATTPEVLVPTPTPTLATSASNPTPRASNPQVAKPAVTDPLLPIFGLFPPIPIPNRPANLNPLTGLTANPAALQRRPILVRIGNDEKVRTSNWQAGLNSADLVFEELIDQLNNAYANTRYTAVFLSNDPPLLGPVRSGRIVNFQIAPMLDGALVHAGASNGTRWLFSVSPMVNLDEYFNQPSYCYIQSHGYQGRLYTSGPRLREWLVQKGWEKAIPLFGFDFADAAPPGQAVKSIALTKAPWPKWDQLEWRYDAAANKYLRFVTGSALMDNSYPISAKWGNGADCVVGKGETKTQVSAANVVVLYAKHEKTTIVEDSNNSVSVHIILTGQGDAQFFRDGIMVRGKWQRQSEQEFFRFTDAAGKPFALKPGNTWFEIVPLGYALDLK
ncbi:MAG: DUF3048 C-terminal domain-containing protein [Chloroflexi bacterium]|nr:DUF3048 C-terminal domain-containing protein [Chloroflexota bacterium]